MKSGHAVYVKFTLKSVIKILNEAGSLKEESSTFRKKKKTRSRLIPRNAEEYAIYCVKMQSFKDFNVIDETIKVIK